MPHQFKKKNPQDFRNANRPSRPSSASSNASGKSNKSSKLDWGVKPDRGPRMDEAVCISEEVKIGINLAIERFRLDETQKELEFPTSLTATERAYIHRLGDDFGLKHKSKGKKANRFLVLSKKDGASGGAGKCVYFEIIRNSKSHIGTLLQRFPLSPKERSELTPNLDKNLVNEVSKELARTATGRLNNGVPQVPPGRGNSDLKGFTNTLPINGYKDVILSTIRDNQVCLISGETGSGKTTQVPQMILDECNMLNRPCRILCTQPRRIAALSISERVATERGENVGQTVGFQIRLESRVSPKTLLTFCTNGVLLRTLMGSDQALSAVTHVIVDEVHERDKFSDFLLICLREIAGRNPNLKVILMSATLNIDLFVRYFSNCPVVTVPGSLFPVDEYFLEDILKWTGYTNRKMDTYRAELEKAAAKTEQLAQWCNQDPDKIDPRMFSHRKYDEDSDDEDQREPDDRGQLTDQLAKLGLGTEKENLEPWLVKEMDQYMSEIWLSGNQDLFSQIFHLIMSENVSVDYRHSETTVTPLMIAAGRGFNLIVEQLLTLGADPCLASSNEWTSVDWAKQFKQDDVVALLEAQMLASEVGTAHEELEDDSDLTEADKQMLSVYQHCWDDDHVDISLITLLLYNIVSTQPEGSVLIFLPGYHEIVSLRERIEADEQFSRIRYNLFQLHSSMQSTDQKKVFKPSPPGIRKIILATNIAETSITINDVVYVINSGKVKEKTFDALLKITMLKSNWVSKASVAQRRGRAGRVRKGVCYNMFSRVRYQHMSDYAVPELLRCPLQELCLQTKLLAPVDKSIFDFLSKAPESPPFMVVRSAISVLKDMDALDNSEEMTELGRHLADLPVEPHLGKMVLYSIVLKCVDPVLTVVCSLSYKDPFQIPAQPSEKRMLAAIRRDFSAETFSDHMTLLRLFQAWQKARSEGWERQFCQKNYISMAVMEMIVGMRAQLLGQLRASGFVRARGGGDIRDLNTNSENWSVVKAALFAGAFPNVLRFDRNAWKYCSQSSEKTRLHISSVLPQAPGALPSDWLFYEEMCRSGEQGKHGGVACVRCCTVLSPLTVAMFAGPSKLPPDALKYVSEDDFNDGAPTSDSENEDPEDNKYSTLQLVDWFSFKLDAETAELVLQLRQKWHCLFLRRMRAPAKPLTQMDEAVIQALVNVLTNEEQALGLQQPAGIGQRPRPMSAESIMSGSYSGRANRYNDATEDMSRHRFSTSAKKATSTPPKRKDFMSPKMRSNESSKQNSPSLSHYSSDGCSPFNSPQMDPASGGVRYFIMKCSSQRNIDISVNKGAWATSKANEQKLNKAFLAGDTVYLIFSIQGSGHFQGYASMSSCIGTDKSSDYNGQGGVFSVDWIKRGNIKFQSTHHLMNPWNEGKRVQVSRDGQEVEPTVGEALVSLWDATPDNDGDTRWSEEPHGAQNWSRGQPVYVTESGDGYHDNRQFGYQGQQQQYGYHDRHYNQQQDYSQYQTWGQGQQGGGGQRLHYSQRQRGQGHYQGYGNHGYSYQGQEPGQHYFEPGAQYNRNTPGMILQRDQRHSGYQKHKK